MKMSDAERLTLIRLHEVLALLKPKEAKEHDLAIQVLRDGYHEDLYEQMTGTYLSEAFSDADQKLIYDVLDLYAGLNQSYHKLSKADKKHVDKSQLRFPGFDQASEHAQLRFIKFVIKKQHKWPELDHKSDFNSDRPMLAIYKVQLRESRKIKSELGQYTADQINGLLEWSKPASGDAGAKADAP